MLTSSPSASPNPFLAATSPLASARQRVSPHGDSPSPRRTPTSDFPRPVARPSPTLTSARSSSFRSVRSQRSSISQSPRTNANSTSHPSRGDNLANTALDQPTSVAKRSLSLTPPPKELPSLRGGTASTNSNHNSQEATDSETKRNVSDMAESLIKKPRPDEPDPKVMPIRYETCDVKDLVLLISRMIMELLKFNDGIPLRDRGLTRFHSRAPPAISVQDYLQRLTTHATLSPPILLSMVYYIDRLCAHYPAFTISSLTVHRFLIVAATVASKGLSDSFWTNSLYARVGGVTIKELALLELEFLRRVDWRIVPKPEILDGYYRSLIERDQDYTIASKEPEDTPMQEASTPADRPP
ncbi:MAG: hypothetical protein M1814_005887 [Vezdaea aestivalis]|nr:MAG: hypothetical protein M1814_005887 [Vezdaea aestivalis]